MTTDSLDVSRSLTWLMSGVTETIQASERVRRNNDKLNETIEHVVSTINHHGHETMCCLIGVGQTRNPSGKESYVCPSPTLLVSQHFYVTKNKGRRSPNQVKAKCR